MQAVEIRPRHQVVSRIENKCRLAINDSSSYNFIESYNSKAPIFFRAVVQVKWAESQVERYRTPANKYIY
jgi:hypothetical protein